MKKIKMNAAKLQLNKSEIAPLTQTGISNVQGGELIRSIKISNCDRCVAMSIPGYCVPVASSDCPVSQANTCTITMQGYNCTIGMG